MLAVAAKPQVLVIESRPLFRQLYRALFRNLGCQAVCISKVGEPASAFDIQTLLFAVVDVPSHLGAMEAAVASVRGLPGCEHLPVLLISKAHVTNERHHRNGEADEIYHAVKPIQIGPFTRSVHQFLASNTTPGTVLSKACHRQVGDFAAAELRLAQA